MSMKKNWSHHVTTHSNAMDLEPGVFTQDDPKAIARSLKRSAERSTRRKSEPKRSAMSMLNLYINRAGKNLSGHHRQVLERAKDELRALFDGTSGSRPPARNMKVPGKRKGNQPRRRTSARR
ncbi:MAG: DUF3175 domain-containing protein [Candidatus Eremiobacteraeota bacterium]|nr:DUF3175 domain-containing protein [Candidatus Eremiobacteraeota bacterium]